MRAGVLAVDDGAPMLCKAVREVFAETCDQRCWWLKTGEVRNSLPESLQPAAQVIDDPDALRAIAGPHLIALVGAGATFEKHLQG